MQHILTETHEYIRERVFSFLPRVTACKVRRYAVTFFFLRPSVRL